MKDSEHIQPEELFSAAREKPLAYTIKDAKRLTAVASTLAVPSIPLWAAFGNMNSVAVTTASILAVGGSLTYYAITAEAPSTNQEQQVAPSTLVLSDTISPMSSLDPQYPGVINTDGALLVDNSIWCEDEKNGPETVQENAFESGTTQTGSTTYDSNDQQTELLQRDKRTAAHGLAQIDQSIAEEAIADDAMDDKAIGQERKDNELKLESGPIEAFKEPEQGGRVSTDLVSSRKNARNPFLITTDWSTTDLDNLAARALDVGIETSFKKVRYKNGKLHSFTLELVYDNMPCICKARNIQGKGADHTEQGFHVEVKAPQGVTSQNTDLRWTVSDDNNCIALTQRSEPCMSTCSCDENSAIFLLHF